MENGRARRPSEVNPEQYSSVALFHRESVGESCRLGCKKYCGEVGAISRVAPTFFYGCGIGLGVPSGRIRLVNADQIEEAA
jgi:hypothetical protein